MSAILTESLLPQRTWIRGLATRVCLSRIKCILLPLSWMVYPKLRPEEEGHRQSTPRNSKNAVIWVPDGLHLRPEFN